MKLFCVLFLACLVMFSFSLYAQDRINSVQVRSVKLFRSGDQASLPIIAQNSQDGLQLEFDDFDNRVKNYYYTFQLCNADWSPSILQTFEYLKGFQNVRITTYRNSSIAAARYIHYQASVPDRNCYPSRSGNYLLKVFLDNDTSKTVFTKRLMVAGSKVTVAAQIQQPFNAQFYRTAQRMVIGVQSDNLQVFSPNDLKIVVLQNNNWQTALQIDRPTISRGNYFEYSDEAQTAMPGGKEFRWADLRSLRLLSDRVDKMERIMDTTHVYLKTDVSRAGQSYVYYRDINGGYVIEALESINPFWQGDYANVHFEFVPPGGQPMAGQDIYLFGELTNYAADTSAKMAFNREKGVYEKTLYLKQGYYNYAYINKPAGQTKGVDFSKTEGDFWGTENSYTVLVYFRPFGARADELVGFTSLNSAFQRTGF